MPQAGSGPISGHLDPNFASNFQIDSVVFLFRLLFEPEDRSQVLLRKDALSQNYAVLEPAHSTSHSDWSQNLKSNLVIAFICLFL